MDKLTNKSLNGILKDKEYLMLREIDSGKIVELTRLRDIRAEKFRVTLDLTDEQLRNKVDKAYLFTDFKPLQLHYDGAYNKGYMLIYGDTAELITTAKRWRCSFMTRETDGKKKRMAGPWISDFLRLIRAKDIELLNFDTNWFYRDVEIGKEDKYIGSEAFDILSDDCIDKFKMTGLIGESGYAMFSDCKIKELDLSGSDAGELIVADEMFEYGEFGSIDLSTWDLSKLETAVNMFSQSKIGVIDLGKNKLERLEKCMFMFQGTRFKKLRITREAWDRIVSSGTSGLNRTIKSKVEFI